MTRVTDESPAAPAPDQTQTVSSHCRVCYGERFQFRLRRNGFDIFRCEQCGFQFVWPVPDEKTLFDFYQRADYLSSEGTFGYADYEAKRDFFLGLFRGYLKVLRNYMVPGRLLDVGCGNGDFMMLANDAGWEVYGVEICRSSREQAERKFKERIFPSLQDLGERHDFFDLITMWEFIEHLPDPDQVLDTSLSLLRRGGLLALTTPNTLNLTALRRPGLWPEFKPPEHLQFFDFETLEQLLTHRHALSTVELEGIHQDWRLQAADWIEALLGWAERLRKEHPARTDPVWWIYAVLARLFKDFPRRLCVMAHCLDRRLLSTGIFCVVRK